MTEVMYEAGLRTMLGPVQDRKGVIFEDPEEGVGELIKALQQEGVLER
jgi:hypothetical protein